MATDDQAVPVQGPMLDVEGENPEGDTLASQQDQDTAAAFFHPAWDKVAEIIHEGIVLCESPVDPKLSAEEYKIEGLSNAKVKAKLNEILIKVANAVSAVESTPKKPKRRTAGGQ